MPEQTGGVATSPTALPQRRPRVREVSSRFMSPSIQHNPSPTSTSDSRRSKSAHRRQTDENLIPDPNIGLDKPSTASTVQRKHPHQRANQHVLENRANSEVRVVSKRPDTPIAERVVPSRYRQVPNTIQRSILLNSVSKAERLLQEATLCADGSCPGSPPCAPDVDRCVFEKNRLNLTTDCTRSLNFSSYVRISPAGVSVPRPPHPNSSTTRAVLDARKGIRKFSNHHEDHVHSLKVLSNHHLQWRFANAKAEACLRSQKQDAERNICSLGQKISDIRDNVIMKRNEFALFRGIKTLTTIVEAQMPYLDEWSTLEEDYSYSLLGATNALLNSSVRFPVGEEVRVDARELGEALDSALKVVELVGSNIQRFVKKAVEMDISVSELARTVSEEKSRIDEYGCMLSKTYSLQVKECSLRGTLMQAHHCCKSATIINPCRKSH